MEDDKIFTRNFNLVWLTTFMLFTSFHSLMPTMPFFALKLGATEAQVGLVMGVYTLSAVIFRPFIGRELDRGAKKLVLVIGILIFISAVFSYNFIYFMPILLVNRFWHGIGWAATTTTSHAMVADFIPPRKRGEAIGYFGVASNLGGFIGPSVGMAILLQYNFKALFIFAGIIAIISFFFGSSIKERKRPEKTASEPKKGKFFPRKAFIPAILVFVMTLSFGGVNSFTAIYAFKNGLRNPGIFFSINAAFVVLARIISGRISDRWGRSLVISLGMFSMAVALTLLSLSHDPLLILMAAPFYGLGFGSAHPALMTMTVDRASPQEIGAAMGLFTMAFDLGIGVGATLWGIVIEHSSYNLMFFLAGLSPLIGGLSLFCYNIIKHGAIVQKTEK